MQSAVTTSGQSPNQQLERTVIGHRVRAASAAAPLCAKIRELVAELEGAGFVNRGGKGSHRNYVHPRLSKPITISGKLGDDAKQYQIRAVRTAIAEVER